MHGSKISSESSYKNCTTFNLSFKQTVDITESFYPELSYTELFSSLGGTLGFWLGIGIMQILEYGFNIASIIDTFKI